MGRPLQTADGSGQAEQPGATVQLVPYKPPRYLHAQATVLNFLVLLTMSVARIVEEQIPREDNVFVLPLLAMIVTVPLFYVAASIWTRFQNLELVPYAETLRRYFESANKRSLFDSGWRMALHVGTLFLVAGLTILPIKVWLAVVPIVGVTLFFGFVAGVYSALYARRWAQGAEDPGSVQAVSSAERNGRHYFGYALGLAAAYGLAAYVDARPIVALAVIVAFVAGKFVGDLILPQPPYNFSLPIRVRLLDPLRLLIFGALRWGVPLAALCFVVARTLAPDVALQDLAPVVVMLVIIGALWGLFFWLIALASRWGRKVAPPAAALVTAS